MLSEAERDRRTVFVQQLAAKLSERELCDFLASKIGPVRAARIVTDKITRRSRGFGYVEFVKEESVPLAILLSGERLKGIPILISYTETEKNRLAEEAKEIANRAAMASLSAARYTKLSVANIHPELAQDKLRLLFEPFGPLEAVSLARDSATGRSKGTAVVHYKNYADAKNAMEKLRGLDIAGYQVPSGFLSFLAILSFPFLSFLSL